MIVFDSVAAAEMEYPKGTPVLMYSSGMADDLRTLLSWDRVRLATGIDAASVVSGRAESISTRIAYGVREDYQKLDAVFPRLVLVVPPRRSVGAWTSTRDAPRFLDECWEQIQEARAFRALNIRVLGAGPITEDMIVRYPWDAVVAPNVQKHVIAAHAARWERNRWWK